MLPNLTKKKWKMLSTDHIFQFFFIKFCAELTIFFRKFSKIPPRGSWKLGLGEPGLAPGILKIPCANSSSPSPSFQDPWRQLKLPQSQFSRSLAPTQAPPVPVFKIPGANSSSPSPSFQDPWPQLKLPPWRQLKLPQSQFSRSLAPTQAPPVPVFKIPGANSSSPSPSFQDPWPQLKLPQSQFSRSLAPTQAPPVPVFKIPGANSSSPSPSFQDPWRQLKLPQSQFSRSLAPTQAPPVPVFKIPGPNSSSPSPSFQDPWRQLTLPQSQFSRSLAPTQAPGGTWVGTRGVENWDWWSLSWRQVSWELRDPQTEGPNPPVGGNCGIGGIIQWGISRVWNCLRCRSFKQNIFTGRWPRKILAVCQLGHGDSGDFRFRDSHCFLKSTVYFLFNEGITINLLYLSRNVRPRPWIIICRHWLKLGQNNLV